MIAIKHRMFSIFLIFLLFNICYEIVSGKISSSSKNSGLGWPNFFNPKHSIVREKGGKVSSNEMKENVTSLDFNSHKTEINAGEDFEDEQSVDHIPKGELRGIYLILNSSSSLVNLETEARKKIQVILERNKELFEEVDKELEKGEITDKGVRLQTPIVVKSHSQALGKYGSRLLFYAGEEFSKVLYFGNWCGRGGRSAPVDNIDGCCLEHEKCYGKHVRQCPDVWKKPYSRMYAWTVINNDPVCVRSDTTCVNHVCECDQEVSLCLRHFLQNPAEIPLHVDPPVRMLRNARSKK